MYICVCGSADGPPEQYPVRWLLGSSVIQCATATLTQTDTLPLSLLLSFPLTLSLSRALSLSTPQQARQMAAPQPTVPGKACELKVIPSRSEELPASSRCGRGGAPAHLPSRLWDIWLGFCGMMSVLPPTPATATTAGTVPKGEAGVCSVFLLSNETNERVFVCLVDCAALPVCICVLFRSERTG